MRRSIRHQSRSRAVGGDLFSLSTSDDDACGFFLEDDMVTWSIVALEHGERVGAVQLEPSSELLTTVASPRGYWFVTHDRAGRLTCRSVAVPEGEVLVEHPLDATGDSVFCLASAPARDAVLVSASAKSGRDVRLLLIDLPTGTVRERIDVAALEGRTAFDAPVTVSLDEDARWLLVFSRDGSITEFDLARRTSRVLDDVLPRGVRPLHARALTSSLVTVVDETGQRSMLLDRANGRLLFDSKRVLARNATEARLAQYCLANDRLMVRARRGPAVEFVTLATDGSVLERAAVTRGDAFNGCGCWLADGRVAYADQTPDGQVTVATFERPGFGMNPLTSFALAGELSALVPELRTSARGRWLFALVEHVPDEGGGPSGVETLWWPTEAL